MKSETVVTILTNGNACEQKTSMKTPSKKIDKKSEAWQIKRKS